MTGGAFPQPPGTHLAQLNVGVLAADTDDPRVAPFMDALDRVNGMGKRMPGFVWMMEGSGEPGTGNTEAKIDGDLRAISNLTVWTDVAALERFVWDTVHRQFYTRRAEWFTALAEQHLVLWYVPQGHRPTLGEALERLDLLRRLGPTAEAFDWAGADARRTAAERCAPALGA
ncbi:DUF3291 domain-containing protein [Palleronia sediminis]|uniref:DUF3291 domain-containing protein n=1 Tax=Palleronia sediminis TaxID=2547833 RepID=A0A4R6ALL8_9RHOB|nr:DUF3291 domain-containing protein [Palleronia sediminis]TDL84242.1 DUF3291 domain-containing protein [Palleronia sediminis]